MHRALRHRARLRQADVAAAAAIGRWKIVQLEAGRIGRLFLDDVDRSFGVLGALLKVEASWHGASGERLLDEGHARLVGQVVRLLRQLGWSVEVEVSFSEFGERGAIDIFAWHPAERALVVIEIKSELGSIDGLLRPLDVKVRLAPVIAAKRFGWRAASVSRIVVLPEDRTACRAVERHERVLSGALPARGREVRRWLRSPSAPIAGLWFLTNDGRTVSARNPSSVRRVHRHVSRSGEPTEGAGDGAGGPCKRRKVDGDNK